MAAKTLGTMSNTAQAVSAKSHTIIIPAELKRSLGRAAVRATKIRQTEAGQAEKKIEEAAILSGVPLQIFEKRAENSAKELTKQGTLNEINSVLKKNGIIPNDMKVDFMNEGQFNKMFSEIDKFAQNKNLGRLSLMSKSKLKEMLNNLNPTGDKRKIIECAIQLKDHQKNLTSLRLAKGKLRMSAIQVLRRNVKDVDAANSGLTIYETVTSTKRTIKTIQKMKKMWDTHQNNAPPKQTPYTKATTSKGSTAPSTQANTAKTTGSTAKTSGTNANTTAKKAGKKITKITKKAGRKAAKAAASVTAKASVGSAATGSVAAGSATAGGATAGGATATAGGVSIWPVLLIVAIVLVVGCLFLLLTLGSASSSTAISGFFGKNGSDKHTSVYETQAGKLYTSLKEKDVLFIDKLNNYKNTHEPSSVSGKTVYGYWNHEEGRTEILSKWSKASTKWVNGNGESIAQPYNVKDIISAATVFIDQEYNKLPKTYIAYANNLWNDTHKYVTFNSNVYSCSQGCSSQSYLCTDKTFYDHKGEMVIVGKQPVAYSESGCEHCHLDLCSGCVTVYCEGVHEGASCLGHSYCPGHLIDKDGNNCNNHQRKEITAYYSCDGCLLDENGTKYCPKDGQHAVSKYAISCKGHCSGHDVTLCLGHVDLKIVAIINFLEDENNSVFDVDSTGKITGNGLSIATGEKYRWDGWTTQNKQYAIHLASDDWYVLYGIGESQEDNYTYASVSADVEAYTFLIQQYAIQHGIPEYVELIKAVMMQESGGRGNDPMQASECGFNTRYPNVPNGITDPEYSINVGIQYFASCLRQAGAAGPSDMDRVKIALQGYNYGTGYISWALENYGEYSLANASEFSDLQAAKMGWSGYGDKLYVPHVLRYYNLVQGNQSIVDAALSQVGNVGGEPYWSWYGYSYRVEWCACFVSWCANQSGHLNTAIDKFAYCPYGVNWFKERGEWKDRHYEPKAGDIIFFDWEGDGISDHVGIVVKTSDGVVYTVEGNSSDECKKKQYIVGSDVIYGYGTPSY